MRETSLAAVSTESLILEEPRKFPLLLQRRCKGVALVDIFEAKCPSLRKLGVEYGVEQVKLRVKALLLWINEIANLNRGLNPFIIESIADTLVDTYPYYNLTLEDLNMALMDGVSGKYSKDGIVLVLNMSILMSWINKHFDKRSEEAFQWNKNKDGYHPCGVGQRSSKETLVGFIMKQREREKNG